MDKGYSEDEASNRKDGLELMGIGLGVIAAGGALTGISYWIAQRLGLGIVGVAAGLILMGLVIMLRGLWYFVKG